jgi:hypothetical protein
MSKENTRFVLQVPTLEIIINNNKLLLLSMILYQDSWGE